MQYRSSANAHFLFFRLTAALVIFLLLLVCLFSKTTCFLAANFYHAQWLDVFFTYFTNLGDGIFAILLIVLFFIRKKKVLSIKLLISFLLSGCFAQLLKHAFHAPRPKAFFDANFYRHFIDGVTNSGLTSFPSGHSTTAFALATTLAFNIPCKRWGTIFFLLALAVVYSRVYLGQHFVEDTLAGIILGTFTSLLIEYFYSFHKMYNRPSKQRPALQHESLTIEL